MVSNPLSKRTLNFSCSICCIQKGRLLVYLCRVEWGPYTSFSLCTISHYLFSLQKSLRVADPSNLFLFINSRFALRITWSSCIFHSRPLRPLLTCILSNDAFTTTYTARNYLSSEPFYTRASHILSSIRGNG